MSEPEASSSTRLRWAAIAGGVALTAGLLVWLALPPDEQLPQAAPEADRAGRSIAEAPGSDSSATSAPKTLIPDKGRAKVSLADVRRDDVLVVGLSMPDAARGDGMLATKVVDATRERMIEVETVALDGAGAGVRLEIDPEWLEPGPYMIQVRTNETDTHFPVRRYVLEVE